MTSNININDWLENFSKDDIQLALDFDDDNMAYTGSSSQPALTISAIGNDTIDTITLNGINYGASGSNYNYNFNSNSIAGANGPSSSIYTTNGTGGYTITTGTGIGQILTTNTNGLTWSDFSNINPSGHSLEVKGDANFEGDVKIKGKSLIDSLEKIEEKLAILRPNEKLEEKWDELRELRKKYMELEKEIIEKEKMWEILKR